MRRSAAGIGLVLLAATLSAAPACKRSDSIVVVTVDADAAVTGVFQLRAFVSNADETTTRFFPPTPAAQPIAFQTSFSLSVPPERMGGLDIAIDGLDAGGGAVANGAATVALLPGDTATVTITLHTGPSMCGNGVVDSGETCDDGDRFSNGN